MKALNIVLHDPPDLSIHLSKNIATTTRSNAPERPKVHEKTKQEDAESGDKDDIMDGIDNIKPEEDLTVTGPSLKRFTLSGVASQLFTTHSTDVYRDDDKVGTSTFNLRKMINTYSTREFRTEAMESSEYSGEKKDKDQESGSPSKGRVGFPRQLGSHFSEEEEVLSAQTNKAPYFFC